MPCFVISPCPEKRLPRKFLQRRMIPVPYEIIFPEARHGPFATIGTHPWLSRHADQLDPSGAPDRASGIGRKASVDRRLSDHSSGIRGSDTAWRSFRHSTATGLPLYRQPAGFVSSLCHGWHRVHLAFTKHSEALPKISKGIGRACFPLF